MPLAFTPTNCIRHAPTLTYSAMMDAYLQASVGNREPTRIYASPKMLLKVIARLVGLVDVKSYRGPLQFQEAVFWLDSAMADNELRFSWVETMPDGSLRDAPHRDVWLIIGPD